MSISSVLQGVINTFTVGQDIYNAVVRAMDAAQSGANGSEDKKAWVMAYAKSIILEAGKNWDKWMGYVSSFIDSAKSLYNSVKGIIK